VVRLVLDILIYTISYADGSVKKKPPGNDHILSNNSCECGTKGIAGSLVWINFDRHALLNLFYKAQGKFVADVDEIRPNFQQGDSGVNAVYQSSITRSVGPSIGDTIDKLDNVVTDVSSLNTVAAPWYSDQVLPFNVTYSKQRIVGLSVLPHTTPSRTRKNRKPEQTACGRRPVSRRPVNRRR